MPRFLRYLKTQIIIAIMLMVALFAASALYSIHVIDQQQSDQALQQLAGRLQFHQQHLTMAAMQYDENAPRDYAAYYRDLRLYFQDLKHTRQRLNDLTDAFARNDFSQVMEFIPDQGMAPSLPMPSHDVARQLAQTWTDFSATLDERIGDDLDEPRLEWAAEWITAQNGRLEPAVGDLIQSLEKEIMQRAERARTLSRLMLVGAVLLSLGIALWFYLRVLRPMSTTVHGFNRVASGDFAHRVPDLGDNEFGWMVGAFNRLSDRLETVYRLLTRLEQGGDLESTLHSLSETLPSLMPVDWIGVLVVGADGRIHLEKAFSDGEVDPLGQQTFDTDQTLLQECLETRRPLHIPDVGEMGRLSSRYVFLHRLEERGRRDAIFLPIGNGAQTQGVLVFASRFPNSYRSEHLELLQNLGVLLGVSLGRTVVFAQRTRLASIGQFASGIVHEIRNPLATISMALEHIRDRVELNASSEKRVVLASGEINRLERLLADILLYAKPLTLDRVAISPCELLQEVLQGFEVPGRFEIHSKPCPDALIDADRMRQVLINLLRNAEQASPADELIRLSCAPDAASGWVEITIKNGGPAIPTRILDRIFEPFVTSKSSGTGLGLSIVQRIVEAHGGDIQIASSEEHGTRVTLRLPVPVIEVGEQTPRSL